MTLSEFFVWLALVFLSLSSPVVFLSLWRTKIGDTIQKKLQQIESLNEAIKEKENQLSLLKANTKEEIQKIFHVAEEDLIFGVSLLPFDKVSEAILSGKEQVANFLKENKGGSIRVTIECLNEKDKVSTITLIDRVNLLGTFVHATNNFNRPSKEITSNGIYCLPRPRIEIYGVYGPPKP